MHNIYTVAGAKGGVGTTSVCAALAVQAARSGLNTLLASEHEDELFSLLAVPRTGSDAGDVCGLPLTIGGSDFRIHPGTFGFGAIDCGRDFLAADVLVVENSYACLSAVARQDMVHQNIRKVVLVLDPGRALQRQDVEEVIGRSVVVVERDERTARCLDAGLLLSRPPRQFARVLSEVAA